ncbi:3-phosphoglycerate kinase [Pseudomonas gingeri NCPPB 3146 = LMG 5327]|uniref:3-phosphoglycerate kinase n=2 Tax=Pseudomonas gingeri TaxID=117681 RepID=A0A7Y7Y640_9PSED|nr:3-phosphoglycerate kinase [Pseudomonas gingeri]NWC18526.1 3-phosphoglycerate kinase [Pseudomonas gingeri]NWE47043.1 3-phosphoglycerate kinase [Pseudomonas gingeri]NWE69361.1 3-phosphoglycerate kinase [Pseudomonas gingeri]PNQ88176.1 3-phosphoglycerate kinase [Pseudomonas gingeri NCPPB 3146 = LMG 5327]
MRKICCVLLALLPLSAFAYPIDVEKQLNGLSIDYTTYDTDEDIGSINLSNYGKTDAVCKVVFRNGPEAPRTRQVEVPAGRNTNVTAKFNRKIIRLRMDLSCSAK